MCQMVLTWGGVVGVLQTVHSPTGQPPAWVRGSRSVYGREVASDPKGGFHTRKITPTSPRTWTPPGPRAYANDLVKSSQLSQVKSSQIKQSNPIQVNPNQIKSIKSNHSIQVKSNQVNQNLPTQAKPNEMKSNQIKCKSAHSPLDSQGSPPL